MDLSFHHFIQAFNKPHLLLTPADHFVMGLWEFGAIAVAIVLVFLFFLVQTLWEFRGKNWRERLIKKAGGQ